MTRDAHETYLESIESYAGPDATNLRLAQRMAYVLEHLPDGDGFIEAHVFERLVTEALREYPK